MAQIIHGERVGAQGKIRVGCSAAIFSEDGKKILLARRSDNGLWHMAGGGLEPGESAAEACVREIREEFALEIEVKRLIGVYSSPDILVRYADGNAFQFVSLFFEAVIRAGEPRLNDELKEWGYFSLEEARRLDLMGNHVQRLEDAFARRTETVVR